jgi:hypothetical protein
VEAFCLRATNTETTTTISTVTAIKPFLRFKSSLI